MLLGYAVTHILRTKSSNAFLENATKKLKSFAFGFGKELEDATVIFKNCTCPSVLKEKNMQFCSYNWYKGFKIGSLQLFYFRHSI